jgi:hypothetical protein
MRSEPDDYDKKIDDVARQTGEQVARIEATAGRIHEPAQEMPERVALTVRVLATNSARLKAAVQVTGQSTQFIVDTALAAYFATIGIP